MSTRIGLKLEDDLYEAYKEMLWRQKKTIQEDLEKRIEHAVREWEERENRNKEQ